MNKREILERAIRVELGRRNFYDFCNLTEPDFYNDDRPYLKTLCDKLEEFWESNKKLLIINMPPQTGKSRTVQNFIRYRLGKDHTERIISISYNENLSNVFGKNIRNSIMEPKIDPEQITLNDIFDIKIKRGSSSSKMWSLEDSPLPNYLSAGPGSTITGLAGNIIIDDIIKNFEESKNEALLQKHWEFFSGTLLSRLHSKHKIVLIFTRWNEEDLAGRVIEHFESNGWEYEQVIFKAIDEDGKSICEKDWPLKDLEFKQKSMPEEIWQANYQQNPINVQGKMYNKFNTYTHKDLYKEMMTLKGKKEVIDCDRIIGYCDTAAEGSDYLVNVIGAFRDNKVYLLDVIMTKDPMENTEPLVASAINQYDVHIERIEANNGGKGFARNVARITQEDLGNKTTEIISFTQTKNKQTRIFSNRYNVMNMVYYPEDWDTKWPVAYKSMHNYIIEGVNKHDDLQDALTGLIETGFKYGLLV